MANKNQFRKCFENNYKYKMKSNLLQAICQDMKPVQIKFLFANKIHILCFVFNFKIALYIHKKRL